MKLRLSLASTALLMTAMVITACGRDTPPPPVKAQPVRVLEVGAADFSERVVATGLVRAAVEAPLAFKTGGILAEMRVTAGQAVKAGQVLAALNTSDLDAALAQSREGLAKYERDLVRAESLRGKGMISQQAEQDVRAQRDIAKAGLAAAAFNRQHALITAPANGVVLEKRVEARETVAAGQPIVVFGQLDKGWVVKAGVSARDAAKLSLGDPVAVRLDVGTQALTGRLTRLAAASDARTGTVEIEVALPATMERPVSGMVARLEITKAALATQAASSIAVPLSALLEGDAGKGKVFILDAAGDKVKRIEVQTGRLLDGRIEITSGLSPGAKVVSEGAAWLDDGVTVRVLP
jgi:multidrug efflux system membrane fusion protein